MVESNKNKLLTVYNLPFTFSLRSWNTSHLLRMQWISRKRLRLFRSQRIHIIYPSNKDHRISRSSKAPQEADTCYSIDDLIEGDDRFQRNCLLNPNIRWIRDRTWWSIFTVVAREAREALLAREVHSIRNTQTQNVIQEICEVAEKSVRNCIADRRASLASIVSLSHWYWCVVATKQRTS